MPNSEKEYTCPTCGALGKSYTIFDSIGGDGEVCILHSNQVIACNSWLCIPNSLYGCIRILLLTYSKRILYK